jgi:DNA repair protein RadC
MPERDKTTTSPAEKAHYHGQRLRQRFLVAGSEAISDYEMLELILFRAIPQRDVKPLAKELPATFGSFSEVIAAPAERLNEVDGLGEAAIAELKIVQAAANRLVRGEVKARQVLSSWSNVLDYCRAAIAFESKEHFRILFLDKGNHLIADEQHPLRHLGHPGAQPSLRRSHPLARRHRHDAGHRRGRAAAGHFGARPPHRRQGRPRESQGVKLM